MVGVSPRLCSPSLLISTHIYSACMSVSVGLTVDSQFTCRFLGVSVVLEIVCSVFLEPKSSYFGSRCVAQAGLEFMILQPPSLERWDN